MNSSSGKAINRKALIAGISGNVLEWYDFTVYGFFATVIGALFFPDEDKVVQLISAFGVFAAGYLMRPIGGALFGYIGDKFGRKKALIMSVLMMAIPTTLIGFLPTYNSIGWYAALILIILRLIQGLSVGGEFTGSISLLVEMAPPNKRAFFGSWSTFGAFGGILVGAGIATLVTSLLPHKEVLAYGWRIPFILGSVIGITGFVMRKHMVAGARSKDLIDDKGISQSPLLELWKHHRVNAFKVILLSWTLGVSVYLIFLYLPSYLHTFLNVPLDISLSAHTISLAALIIMIPFFGILSDRIGRKVVLFISFSGFILFSYSLFGLLFKSTFEAMLLALLAFAVFEALFQSTLPALMTELFPEKIRYTGLSVSYNISLALFGGTTPVFCTWLVKVSGDNVWMPAYYLIFTAVIALVVVFTLPETYKKPLE